MKTFFLKTRLFWVITRILFIALYIGTVISSMHSDIFVTLILLPVIAIMIYVATLEFLNKDKFIGAKVLLGVFSIFMSAVIAGLIIYVGIESPSALFAFLFPLYYMLYGLWEIYSTKTN